MKGFKTLTISVIIIIISAYAEFSIPSSKTGIPFTGQSLAIFLIAAFLSPKDFLYTIVIYLIMGVIGIPVFAGGSSGLSIIIGPSGGFLYGFVISGYIISTLFLRREERKFFKVLLIFITGTILLFIFGLIHLTIVFDVKRSFEYGFIPFWKMAVVKAFLASIIFLIISRSSKKINANSRIRND